MRTYAERYARHGWPVFPCRMKAPLTQHGFQDATCDLAQIAEWWTRWPEANIGMATGERSGVFVIDIDCKELDGYAAWRDLCAAHEWQTPVGVLCAGTPSGGGHLYFHYVQGVTNGRGALPPGIDVRGQGGYVLVAPSIIRERKYAWMYPGARDPIEPPVWLLELLRRPSAPSTPSSDTPPAHVPVNRGPSIIDAYNTATDIHDLLRHYGYTVNEDRFTRPGKDPKDGISGTIKNNRAYTFSANDPAYDPADTSPSGAGCTLNPFDLLTRLSFNGDPKAAVNYLREARR